MRILLAYVIVLPLSFLVSRLGAIVVGAPIAFILMKTSTRLRTTVGGFIACLGGVAAAVTFGWCVFNWVVGQGSFTLVPFLASVLILTISIPKDFRQSQNLSQTQAEVRTSGQGLLADEFGNPWSTVIGDVSGLILATIWFYMAKG